MRICIDIDGTICPIRAPEQSYDELLPLEGACEKIRELKEKGYYIILSTARHMKTCESNIGLVVAKEGLTLLEWLKKYNFIYDEIWFGKPYAQIYIDDRALKFEGSWNNIEEEIIKKYCNHSPQSAPSGRIAVMNLTGNIFDEKAQIVLDRYFCNFLKNQCYNHVSI